MPISRFAYLLVLAAASWLFLWNLGANSISLRSDEVIYVRATQAVLHNGDIFPLMHGGVPMYEKPPLKLWLGSLAPLMLGESNLSFRLLDGVLGVLAVILTVSVMRAISGSMWLGMLSGVLLFGMPELVISHHGFRRAVLDGLLTVVTLLAGYETWRIVVSRNSAVSEKIIVRHYITVGALCSVAVLTKSVAGFVPAACALATLLEPTSKKSSAPVDEMRAVASSPAPVIPPPAAVGSVRGTAGNRAWLWIVSIPLATLLVYCGALWFVAGAKALKVFIGVEILTRTFSGFEGHNTGQNWFYLWSLFSRGAAVPRLLLYVGVLGAFVSFHKEQSVRFLLVWAGLPVILYSLAASKVPWYLNPFLPFIGMLAVAGTAQIVTRAAQKWGKVVAGAIALLVALAAVPAYSRAVVRHVKVVNSSTERLEIDKVVESLKKDYSRFAIIDDALSGWTNPRKGRFNVEGIYREMLKPGLRSVKEVREFAPLPGEVVLIKEESLNQIPPGWRAIAKIAPFASRGWTVVAVVY
ncbi:MAG: ArnT family glycosyltransferase [Pseudomonadota bacterium]|jgi:4-amino-4-deoxy-L-arabinose transferase-like glycosyltransferase